MTYLQRLLIWSFLGTAFNWAMCAQNKERFVDEILSDYRVVDQAGRGDTSRDGFITDREFAYSLYQNADIEGNNDNGVTMNEFVDHYVRRYNISSELAIFMFDLLNDPGSNDNIITASDISPRSFLGRDYASIAEYRDALYKWTKQAAQRLYNVLANPHIIDTTSDLAPRYDILSKIDTNGDDVISFQEFREEIHKFSTNITRNAWIERNVHVYGAHPVTSILTFDYWDRNGDLLVTLSDLQAASLDLDYNGDGRISRQEFLQYFERGYELSRRISGNSIQLPLRACPVPWWSKMRGLPSIDAVRAAMDFDDDFDGWISLDNVRRWLMLFDINGDGFLSRSEYIKQHTSRYGLNSTTASVMFDLADVSGDDRIGEDDWHNHFKGGIEISFCDVRRSIFDLARMADTFSGLEQAPMKRTSMNQRLREEWNWFVENHHPSDWMGLGPYGNGPPQRDLCQGQDACYMGEHTNAWGLPGASMWWGSGIGSDWASNEKNMFQIPGPLFAGVFPTMVMGDALSLKRATDKPSNFPGSEHTARQVSGDGSSDTAEPKINKFPFGGISNQYPNINGKGQNTNPFMKQFQQRDFNQQKNNFGPQGNSGLSSQMRNVGTNDRQNSLNTFPQNPFRSNIGYPDNQTPTSFGPVQNGQNRFTGMNQRQGNNPTPQSWSQNQNPNLEATATPMTRFPMQNQLTGKSQPPFISLGAYPLVLSLDPSLFGSSMFWRTMQRKRKDLIDKADSSSNQDLKNIQKMQDVGHREKREETASEQKKNETESVDEKNEEDSYSNNDDWGWDHMMPGFQPSPFDIWMSMVLERFMWENDMAHNDNGTDSENGTSGEIKDPEKLWEEFEMLLNNNKEKESNSETAEESAQPREKRSFDEQEVDKSNDYRNKRWVLYVQRLKRNPYLNAMRGVWPGFYNMFPSEFWFQTDRTGFPLYKYPYFAFPGWRRPMSPNRLYRWNQNRMRKRKTREASEENMQDVSSMSNEKRAFSFDNWFKNKDEKVKKFKDTGRTFAPSSTNKWKSVESNKYGMKNKWGQSVQEESRKWDATSKESLDYSTGKWNNNQGNNNNMYQNGYSPNYSQTEERLPLFQRPDNGGDMGRFLGPHGMWMQPGFEGAAFWMGHSPPFPDMDWSKRQMTNGPQQNLKGRFSSNRNPQSNGMSATNNFPQRAWKQQNNWQGFSGEDPWVNRNSEFNLQRILNDGVSMWNQRFMRKAGDEGTQNADDSNMSENANIRQKRSNNNINKKKIMQLKHLLKDYKQRKKSSVGISKWMPWQSWTLVRNKKSSIKDSGTSVFTFDENSEVMKFLVHGKRQKRSKSLKNKRWGQIFPMGYQNDWNWMRYPWMNFQQWNSRYGRFMRFHRQSDGRKPNIKTKRDVREKGKGRDESDASESMRQKRFGWWNWNGMWNPSMYQSNWNPWYNQGNWNRWPRQSADEDHTKDETTREERDAEESDRDKRWSHDYPMGYGNRWNGNPWMYNQWNPWYSTYMRFPRQTTKHSDEEEELSRDKRDATDPMRQKRFGWWNWNSMWNPSMYQSSWNPWYYRWNGNRWPRQSADEDQTKDETTREKRDAEESNRDKRWSYDYPMGYENGWNGNPWMYNQWIPWYRNYMRFPRQTGQDISEDTEGTEREKRDASDPMRQKRFGWWNWNGMWNPFMYQSSWNPGYNQGNWNRWPRQSADEDLSKDETTREKRDAEESERDKRWSYDYPMGYGKRWNGNPWMYNQWNPWYSNYMRFPRKAGEEKEKIEDPQIEKRDTSSSLRQRRYNWWNMYGMWNSPTQSSNWNPWCTNWNWNRYPRHSNNGEKEKEEHTREKRDVEESDRDKRWSHDYPMGYGNGWNGNPWMYNQWNPWYNNYMRFPRQTGQESSADTEGTDRDKRDAPDSKRQKRFGWRNWYGMWNPSIYQSSWKPWYNRQRWNFMRYSRKSGEDAASDKTTEQEKREEIEPKRNKRWNMMHPWHSNRHGMWNPSTYQSSWNPGYNRWNWNRWPRQSADDDQTKDETTREKRDAEESNRDKRWSHDYPMGYGNGWNGNPWMHNQWIPWYRNYMRFPRQTGQDISEDTEGTEREKRDASDPLRQKRFGWWNWNGMWNPFMYQSSWNPGYNRWNWNRWPRQSADEDQTKDETTREKRDAEESDRDKRWSHDYPMGYGNGWNGNPWMHNQWNPWYNNYMRFPRQSGQESTEEELTGRNKRDAPDSMRQKRFRWWNWNGMWNPSMYQSSWNPGYNRYRWNFMRYPRKSGEQSTSDKTAEREKREDIEPLRKKRMNMMHPWNWHNNKNGMWNPSTYQSSWNPGYNRWNWNRWPRQSADDDQTKDETTREKRDAEESNRDKRWSHDYPMGYGNGWNGNPWMHNQWIPWYRNYMRFPRQTGQDISEDTEGTEREKRDASDPLRQKRFGWWNWNGMWNPFMYQSSWNPGYNRWNWNRWPRQSADEDQTKDETTREKRDAEESDRDKRWSHDYPMGYGNGWNGNPWMHNQWNPWYNNYMRFPRQSGQESTEEELTGRNKRDAPDSMRQKRFRWWNWNGMWNPSMYQSSWNPGYNRYRWNFMRYPRKSGEQSTSDKTAEREKREDIEPLRKKRMNMMHPWNWHNNKNGMWNPSMSFSNWSPWYNRWNWNRWPRQSADEDQTKDETTREKRDAEESDRDKRWSHDYPMGYGNGWNGNPWMHNQWNPWYNNYMRFPRQSGQESTEEELTGRNKRDAPDSMRQKRFRWWNWNGMWNPSMYQSSWNPGYNRYRWNFMRYPRKSGEQSTSDKTAEREKREDIEPLRKKRMNMMHPWNWHNNKNGMWNPSMSFSNWSPWYNRWNWNRWPRQSADEDQTKDETTREKRDAEESDRDKRWSHDYPMGYGNGWNGNPWMHNQWNPWYNNYMRFPRQSGQESTEEELTGRNKRDAPDSMRQKRFRWWNWNGMWNPSMYQSSWNPGYNRYRWNFMRYPRKSGEQSTSDKTAEREKREDIEPLRKKRMNMMHPWNWHNNKNGMWNPSMSFSNWSPWYNRWNWNRWPRQSADEDQTKDETTREKRDAEESDRDKRWSHDYPMGYGNGWNGNPWMHNQWNPWYNNYMRFPRQSGQESTEEELTGRNKRDAPDSMRQKRFRWWNWNGMWNPSMYQSSWNPGYNRYRWNFMRYPRKFGEQSTSDKTAEREKREDIEPLRKKRMNMMHPWNWHNNKNGMWNPSMSFSNWSPWYNRWNWNRWPRQSADEDQTKDEITREKRDAEESDRDKRWSHDYPMGYGNGWNGNPWMYSQWNPWYNNYMRFPRQSGQESTEEELTGRNKRDAPDSMREKRFGWWNWNGMWNPSMYQSSWNPGYNRYRSNFMRYPRKSGEQSTSDKTAEREKREEIEPLRKKRMNMMHPWNWHNNKHGMWNPSMSFSNWSPWYNRWNWNRWPRQSAVEDQTKDETTREKRDTEESDRDKRWSHDYPMGYGNGWNGNPWMYNQWNPWYSNYMRFPRQSGKESSEEELTGRNKRDAPDSMRQKRFGWWNWNGMWNPSMYQSCFNPWYCRWNGNRWPRQSADEDQTKDVTTREKRDAEESDRDKRWSHDYPMGYGNGWNGNPWMHNQWNPWYNNYMRFPRQSGQESTEEELTGRNKRDAPDSMREKRFGWWNWNGIWNPSMYQSSWNPGYNRYRSNFMRYARKSGEQSTSDKTAEREKREEIEPLRKKRMNMMHPWNWHNNKHGMWNPSMSFSNWSPWYNRWNWNRWPRQSADEDQSKDETTREKRDAEESDRDKRWSHDYPMGYGNGWNGNPWMYNQWNPWYSNYMRFPRQIGQESSVDTDGTDREKRDASDPMRQKRFGWWNWNGMWNPLMYQSSWNPWYNRWNGNRWPRQSADEDQTKDETTREKRDTEESDRDKRWSYDYPMGYGNGWNGNPWMYNQWSPWYSNYMRFPRQSGQESTEEELTGRNKRHAPDSMRQKRFGWWNWNYMWNPSMYQSSWNPWYNRWNGNRWPRQSADEDQTKDEITREKRDAEESDRDKRWSHDYPMGYENGWNGNPWMFNQWNPWYSNYNMRFLRTTDQDIEEDSKQRVKRDIPRQRRFGSWMYSKFYPLNWQGKWYNMWNPSMYQTSWNPWYNRYRWNFMRNPRRSGAESTGDKTSEREKREATEPLRNKLWNMIHPWNNNRHGMWNPSMSFSNWSPWYNRWNWNRWPRQSADEDQTKDETTREKRDVEESDRDKRWSHDYPMGYGNGWNGNPWMFNQWNPWYRNYMRFPRQTGQESLADTEGTDREKRDASDPMRQKRFGWWNWYGMWNPSMYQSRWNPWYNQGNWNRWPRQSADDNQSKDETTREKRDAEESDRNKRWSYDYPMGYGNGWNGNPWMYNQWNPWYINYMRFPRESDAEKNDEILTDRNRRDISLEGKPGNVKNLFERSGALKRFVKRNKVNKWSAAAHNAKLGSQAKSNELNMLRQLLQKSEKRQNGFPNGGNAKWMNKPKLSGSKATWGGKWRRWMSNQWPDNVKGHGSTSSWPRYSWPRRSHNSYRPQMNFNPSWSSPRDGWFNSYSNPSVFTGPWSPSFAGIMANGMI